MVDQIAAEDTRHSARLLQHFGVSTPVMAYHDHSNEHRLQQLLALLLAGKHIALISDAGTPLISDPGYQLVKAARAQGVTVVPVPGACALIAALSVSGLPSNRFMFEGFLSAKSSARRASLAAFLKEPRTVILYESPHRLLATLGDMVDIFGVERQLVIARELTKTYETVLSGNIADLITQIKADPNQQKGEFVLLLEGYQLQDDDLVIDQDVERLMMLLLESMPIKQASSIAAKYTGLKKRDLYQWALARE